MLKTLERLFGFRTSENTNVNHYLNRMDSMGKLDTKKTNQLLAIFINKFIEYSDKIESLENRYELLSEKIESVIKDHLNKPKEVNLEDRLVKLEEKEKMRERMAKARQSRKPKIVKTLKVNGVPVQQVAGEAQVVEKSKNPKTK